MIVICNLLFSAFVLFNSINSDAFDVFEPSIECTVIKVTKEVDAFGFKKFPKLYTGIFNQSNGNVLKIAGKHFKDIKPASKLKTDLFEQIEIAIGKDVLTLELKGKPMSRNGQLKVNGVTVADVTCH